MEPKSENRLTKEERIEFDQLKGPQRPLYRKEHFKNNKTHEEAFLLAMKSPSRGV